MLFWKFQFRTFRTIFAYSKIIQGWQYITNEKYWLGGYKTAEEIGITAYNRQRLEIDANAFAALVMVLSFGMVPTFQSLDLETRHMIEVRARQIMPELDD